VKEHQLGEERCENIYDRKKIEQRGENGDTPYSIAVTMQLVVILLVAVKRTGTQKVGLPVEPGPEKELHEDVRDGDEQDGSVSERLQGAS